MLMDVWRYSAFNIPQLRWSMSKTGISQYQEQLIAENAEFRAAGRSRGNAAAPSATAKSTRSSWRGRNGDQVFTLTGADQVYRELIENMSEGTLSTFSADSVILYVPTAALPEFVKTPLKNVIGAGIDNTRPDRQATLRTFLRNNVTKRSAELMFAAGNGDQIFVNLSMYRLAIDGLSDLSYLVVTDLTDRKSTLRR